MVLYAAFYTQKLYLSGTYIYIYSSGRNISSIIKVDVSVVSKLNQTNLNLTRAAQTHK